MLLAALPDFTICKIVSATVAFVCQELAEIDPTDHELHYFNEFTIFQDGTTLSTLSGRERRHLSAPPIRKSRYITEAADWKRWANQIYF